MERKSGNKMDMTFENLMDTLNEPLSLLLTGMYGSQSEVIVCRLTEEKNLKIIYSKNNSPEHSIGLIYNGISVGILEEEPEKLLKTINTTGGKYIQSCTVPIKSDEIIIGTITVNTDVTNIIFAQRQLADLAAVAEPEKTHACSDVSELMDHMISQAQEEIGKPVIYMKKKDKREFIKYLDDRGFFQIKKSSDRIANYLDISKFTLYSHLEDIRSSEYEDSN